MKKIKISELPLCTSLIGLCTIGTDQQNRSVRIPLDSVLADKADRTELSNILGTPTGQEIEAIEPTLVTEALRKTPQTLTPEEQAQVKTNLGISKMELFIDQWNAACDTSGKYNTSTGYFELNGLTDITYEEAVRIYQSRASRGSLQNAFINTHIRTAIVKPGWNLSADRCCCNNSTIQVIDFPNCAIINLERAFSYASNLHSIFNLYVGDAPNLITTISFAGCKSLAHIHLRGLRVSISFQDSPLISLESFQYLVSNAANTTPITITVHPDVYAKLTDETNTQWYQVLLDAAEKNINFATA